MATVSTISALCRRFDNERIVPQALAEMVLLKEKVLEELDRPQEVGVINRKIDGDGSTGTIGDGATLPTPNSKDPDQATYLPTFIFSNMEFPRGAANLAKGGRDAVDYVFEKLDSTGRDCGATLDRNLFNPNVGVVAVAVVAGDTTFAVADPSGYRPGKQYDVYNGSTFIESFVVKDVSIPATGNSTITPVSALTQAWTTSYDVYMRGNGDSTVRMTCLGDVTAAASLYSKAVNDYDWSGVLDATTTTWTNAAGKKVIQRVARRRKKKPTAIVCNSVNEQRIADAMTTNVRHVSGTMDIYGLKLAFNGLPVTVDENSADKDVWFLQKEDLKVHKFRGFAPDYDSEEKKGMNRGALMISQTKFAYVVQVWGAFNLRVERRNGTGRMSALTA